MLKVADIRHTRAYEQLCLYAIACDMTPAQKGQLVKKFLKNGEMAGVDWTPSSWVNVGGFFTWINSPEGHQFWQEVNNY